MSEDKLDRVASAIHNDTYRQDWSAAAMTARAEARAKARTILSAIECRQGPLEAAKRLLTWHWVDAKKPHVPWHEAPALLTTRLLRQAEVGYAAAHGRTLREATTGDSTASPASWLARRGARGPDASGPA